MEGDILLSGTEIRDILACNEKYNNFMLVINAGGVVDLASVMETRNILVLSQLGAETGNILADILLGRQNPSGKLTTTWVAWQDYPALGQFGERLAEEFGKIVGEEMERFGVHLWLAPALNIHRSIRCGRNFEYFSEDPFVSGIFAGAVTRGVQSFPHTGTTIKHYAFNNQERNRTRNNSQVSECAAREIYLKGFGICVRYSQPKAVMTSYNLANGKHTSEHSGLIEDILHAEFGYKGIVMTDWVIISGLKFS